MAGIEVTRAAAGVSSSKEDLLIAQTNVQQQEIVLKNALSRNVTENAWLDDVHIVPLDHIEIPKTEEVRPVQDLIQEALANRVEIEQSKLNLDSQKIMAKGTRNGLLPSLSAFADVNNQGLAGPRESSIRQLLRRARGLLRREYGDASCRRSSTAIFPAIRPGSPSTFPSGIAPRRPIT